MITPRPTGGGFARLAVCLAVGPLVAACGAGTASVTRPPYRTDSGSLAVHCGTLIDGSADQPQHDVTAVIRDGRIVALMPGRGHPQDLRLLELDGYTCLPGLIDMHTHMTELPQDEADLKVFYTRTRDEAQAIGVANAGATLAAGFTTVRDVGTYVAWTDRILRDSIDRGEVAGPRMQIAGFYLTIPGGGGDLLVPGVAESAIPARVRVGVTRGPAEFAKRAQLAVDGGAGLVKVIASGAVLAYGGVPDANEMTREEIAAAVAVAHAAHLPVAAHAHGAQAIKDAILAGVDTVEHASYIDAEGIALAKAHGAALTMDVYNGDYTDTEGRRQHWPEEFLRKNLESTEAQRRGFTAAHAAGVAIIFGTDAGVYPDGFNARQFPIMVQRGMTPMEAIKSATSLAAHYLGWEDRVGRLAPGLYGDLIAVQGDPLADIGRLQDVAVVIKGGLPFKLPAPR